jgi:hypothetical protein
MYQIHPHHLENLVPQAVWIGLFPACVMKNIINLAQLGSSVMAIAKQDMGEINARKKE